MVENHDLSASFRSTSKLAEDVVEEHSSREDLISVVRHSTLIFEKINEAVSGGIGMRDFEELGETFAAKHPSFTNITPFVLDLIICETAFDLVQAMSQTCGYEELKSYYSTAFGLLMQGFAVGLDRDLYIPDCTETEDGVVSGPFHEFDGFDLETFFMFRAHSFDDVL